MGRKGEIKMSTETKTVARTQPKIGVKALVKIGMLAAVAVMLMFFEIPLPFAPDFMKLISAKCR